MAKKKASPKLETSTNLDAKKKPSSLIWITASSVEQEHLLLLHLKTTNLTFDKIHRVDYQRKTNLVKLAN